MFSASTCAERCAAHLGASIRIIASPCSLHQEHSRQHASHCWPSPALRMHAPGFCTRPWQRQNQVRIPALEARSVMPPTAVQHACMHAVCAGDAPPQTHATASTMACTVAAAAAEAPGPSSTQGEQGEASSSTSSSSEPLNLKELSRSIRRNTRLQVIQGGIKQLFRALYGLQMGLFAILPYLPAYFM